MTGHRFFEVILMIVVAFFIYSMRPSRFAHHVKEIGLQVESSNEIETALDTGSVAQVWAAIDRIHQMPEISDVGRKRIADRLCRLKNEPEFELIRAKFLRQNPNVRFDFSCEGL
jgi:hypothetical protein